MFSVRRSSTGFSDVQAEYRQRLETLEEAAHPLVRVVAAAARWGTPDLDRHWLDLIIEMVRHPRLGGSLDLINLVRAPAVLVFNSAGIGACAGGRDDLLGTLLSDALEVENPYRNEESPAVSVLKASLMYPADWSTKAIRDYPSRSSFGGRRTRLRRPYTRPDLPLRRWPALFR